MATRRGTQKSLVDDEESLCHASRVFKCSLSRAAAFVEEMSGGYPECTAMKSRTASA